MSTERKPNGKTTNAAEAEGLSRKIQTQKFIAYLHFLPDLLLVLQKLSLIFHMDDLFVCSVPR